MGGRVTNLGVNEGEILLPKTVITLNHSYSGLDDAEKLAAIEDALSRLEHDTYGYCESCGGEISVTRLMCDPLICTCSDCSD